MDDTGRTTAQLMAELNELRQRVAELEASAVVRQQPESQRDELLARWQLVLDNMPLGGIIIDPDLRIAYWNAAAEKIFGYTSAEVLGRLHYEVTVPESGRKYVSDLLARTAQNNLTTVGENENITKAGDIIVCEWHNTPLRDAAGRYVGTFAMAQDITDRKRAEEARRRSEAEFRYIFENSTAGVALVSLDGKYLMVNSAFCQIYGYSAEELLKMDFFQVTHPEDLERSQNLLQETKRGVGNFVRYTKRYIHKDGHTIWAEVSSVLLAAADGQPANFITHVTDITERKRAEEALQRLNRELRAISNCSQILARAEDEPTLLNDICHIVCDEAGYCMAWVGYAEYDEARTVRPVAWAGAEDGYLAALNITWTDSERGRGPTGTAIRSGKSVCIQDFINDPQVGLWRESALRRGYHSTIALPLKDESANVFGALSIYSTEPNAFTSDEIRLLEELVGDLAFGITALRARAERKRAEEALRESDERYRATVEQSNDGITVADQSGRYVMVNKAFCSMLGYTREELLQMKVRDVLPQETKLELFSLVSHERKSGQRETELVRKDGSRIIVSITGSPLNIRNESYVQGIVQDITERKRAEEQLLRAQKLESLGILAGGVAHDFNNLLVALLGQTSLAAAKLPPNHPAQRHLDRAVVAAKRAADLTRQMLTYSGHGAFQMTPLDLNALIRDNAGFLESSISKSIALHTDLAETLPFVNADAGQMQQIIMNLVLNAAEAIGDSTGSIRVATSVIDIARDDGCWTRYTGQAVAAGRYVQLRVEDTGHGMSAETLGRIFDPFFTTKFTGRGLGLAAVLGIVRGHRGGLWVESEVGRGTTFSVILPVTAETAAASTIAVPQTPTQQIVLVIDDEEPVLEAVTDMLELDSMSTLCAKTGAEGLALFRERHADIGLIVLDLSMPELSGRETFDQLQRIDPEVSIVLSSGYAQAEATRGFEGRALAGFLQKPYDMETLLQTVRQHLTRQIGE